MYGAVEEDSMAKTEFAQTSFMKDYEKNYYQVLILRKTDFH